MTPSLEAATAALHAIEAELEQRLDEPESIALVAHLRAAGVLDDRGWEHVQKELRQALRFLKLPPPKTFNLDWDPRNESWIRIMRCWRLAGYKLPHWAALWLWHWSFELNSECHYLQQGALDESYWRPIGRVAASLGMQPYRPDDEQEG